MNKTELIAVAAEKAADGAVDQHQRIGQPEQAHVQHVLCKGRF